MTNMEGGGGASPAPSPGPQDQPTDLRVPRSQEITSEQVGGSAPRKHPSPASLSITALPLGLHQLARAPSSFMIGDILRQKAEAEKSEQRKPLGLLSHHIHRAEDEDEDLPPHQGRSALHGECPRVRVSSCLNVGALLVCI